MWRFYCCQKDEDVFNIYFMSGDLKFSNIANDLEVAGLSWHPSIGDEVCLRKEPLSVSILVDSAGMTPAQLKTIYLWLPTVEQMVEQLEFRQAILKHAGLELSPKKVNYLTVVDSNWGEIVARAKTLRDSLGIGLRDLLLYSSNKVH